MATSASPIASSPAAGVTSDSTETSAQSPPAATGTGPRCSPGPVEPIVEGSGTGDDGQRNDRERASSPDDAHDPSSGPSAAAEAVAASVFANGDWQAIYDPSSSRYYFRNIKTNVTQWENPFEAPHSRPGAAAEASPSGAPGTNDIDPELLHLDPMLQNRMAGSQVAPSFSARFNARTGRFEGDPTFDPSRVSEYSRGRKQASAYFDVDGWEKSLEYSGGRVVGTSREIRAREIREGRRLSKDELARFRQRRAEKKAERQRAWLRD